MLQKYPGFVVTNPEEGLIIPYFYHLYPVWIAIFYSLFGIKSCLFVNPFFALLSIFSIYLTGKRLFNENVGLLSAFLLTINVAQVWQARFPTTEILTQFLVFSGIYTLALSNRGKGNFFALVSALCFAEALLTRITVILLIPLIFIVFYCREFKKFEKRDMFFIMPFLVMIAYVLFYDLTIARVPTKFLLRDFRFIIAYRNLFYAITGFALSILVAARLFSSRIAKHLSSFFANPAFRKSVAGFILLLGIYGYFIRPNVIHNSDAANFVELGWFLSPVGLLVGMVGILWLTYKDISHNRSLFYLIALTISIFFLHHKMIHPTYMWAVRRFVPVVIPAITILISYAIFNVFPKLKKIGKTLAITSACYLAVFPVVSAKHLIRHKDYPGVIDFCGKLESMFTEKDILVCDGNWLATPLQYIYGKNTLQISDQGGADAIEKCKRAEEMMIRWMRDGKRVFYITDKEGIFPRFLDFAFVREIELNTHLLRRAARFPKRLREFNPVVNVFRVTEARKGKVEESLDHTIDVGFSAFGLIGGFYKAEKYRCPEGHGTFRWTKGNSEVVIPWPGECSNSIELILRMNPCRPESVAKANVHAFINDQFVEAVELTDGFSEYGILIPPKLVEGFTGNRATLRIECNTWSPKLLGISSDSRNLGVQLDWIRIKTK
jgi:hypothetical protein